MPEDQKEKNDPDTGHDNQNKAEEKIALMREIMMSLD